MDLKRVERIRLLARELIGEIEAIVIGTRNPDMTMRMMTACVPQPSSAMRYAAMVDELIAIVSKADPAWLARHVEHQEDDLLAVGLVNQVIGTTLAFQPPIHIGVKFKRFDVLMMRAAADEYVPSMQDQSRGAMPVSTGGMN